MPWGHTHRKATVVTRRKAVRKPRIRKVVAKVLHGVRKRVSAKTVHAKTAKQPRQHALRHAMAHRGHPARRTKYRAHPGRGRKGRTIQNL